MQINTKVVIEKYMNKTWFYHFFIFYDNMNFHKYIQDQQLHNCNIWVTYITRYIYFIKTLEKDKEDDTWLEHYINLTQIYSTLINDFINKDFDFKKTDLNYWLVTNQYIISEVFGQFFSGLIQKQKIAKIS